MDVINIILMYFKGERGEDGAGGAPGSIGDGVSTSSRASRRTPSSACRMLSS